MRLISIPKRGGKGFRKILVPSPKQKGELRSILYSSLNLKQLQLCDKKVVMGFVPCTSPVLNATLHIGYKFTCSFDLKDFFDSVTLDHVKEYLSDEEISKCYIKNHFWQGLPTSPAICNLAAIKMDKEISEFISTLDDKVVYSRYADDLSISHDKYDTYTILKEKIPAIVAKHNFTINEKKTRLQSSLYGRREITGIYVDDKQIYTSRRFKRNLRAAQKQQSDSARGMEEFAKLKMPNPQLPSKQLENLLSTAIYYNNKAILKNYNDPIIDLTLKPTMERIKNVRLDPTRRNKTLIIKTVKAELNRGTIKREDLIRVTKIKAKL